jgi:hypothetical protein
MAGMHEVQTCRSPPINHKGRPSFTPLDIPLAVLPKQAGEFLHMQPGRHAGDQHGDPHCGGGTLTHPPVLH